MFGVSAVARAASSSGRAERGTPHIFRDFPLLLLEETAAEFTRSMIQPAPPLYYINPTDQLFEAFKHALGFFPPT